MDDENSKSDVSLRRASWTTRANTGNFPSTCSVGSITDQAIGEGRT